MFFPSASILCTKKPDILGRSRALNTFSKDCVKPMKILASRIHTVVSCYMLFVLKITKMACLNMQCIDAFSGCTAVPVVLALDDVFGENCFC